MSSSTPLPLRSEVPVEHTWDTYSVFADDAAWEAAVADLGPRMKALAGFAGRLAEGPQTLLDYLQQRDAAINRVGRIYVYAGGFRAVDTMDQEAQARSSRAGSLFARYGAATAFDEPELLAIGVDKLQAWAAETPGLKVYAHHFERLGDRAAHLRSGEVEEVLAMLGDPLGSATSTAGVLTNAEMPIAPAVDAEGQPHEIAQGTIDDLVTRADRQLRQSAWQNYADAYLSYKRTLANCLSVAVKRDVFKARVRGHEGSLAAALAPERIPVEVFHNLIRVFREHLPTWHRYWRLRRRALGVEQLQPWDLKAPLTQDKPIVPYLQAVDWICEGMAPLGEDYVSTMRRGLLEERWVDIYPNRGKTAGAFSSGVQGTHPFILMSYNDDLFSLSTLAHELGHSMHSYHSWQHQPPIYANYSLFVAEVASNFDQALVRAHLFATQPDPAFQIALIEEAMSNFHRYFFIMPTLARFELECHERVERGEPLTADGMIGLMADLFAEGYGDEVAMDRERVGITWAQFGHLYANFYVYQYATGISAAQALAEPILAGDADAVERYLGFLSAGSSVYGLDALRAAGVDMCSPEPVEAAFKALGQMVDRLETLLD
jgi:oligoendopeptidase F